MPVCYLRLFNLSACNSASNLFLPYLPLVVTVITMVCISNRSLENGHEKAAIWIHSLFKETFCPGTPHVDMLSESNPTLANSSSFCADEFPFLNDPISVKPDLLDDAFQLRTGRQKNRYSKP